MNFPTYRIGLTVFLLGVAIDGRAAPAQPHHGTLPEPKATLGSDRLEIPMDLSTRHPIIEVRINGKGPFRFVFDTGAGGTMIDKAVTEGMDLPTLGMAQVGDASGKGPGSYTSFSWRSKASAEVRRDKRPGGRHSWYRLPVRGPVTLLCTDES